MIRSFEHISSILPRSVYRPGQMAATWRLFTLVQMNIFRPLKLPRPTVGRVLIQRTGILFLILLLAFITIRAQTPIMLNDAVDIAIKNNLSLNNERLKTEYAKALIKSAANIPATQLNGEFGQFNSSYFDTRFSVSQSFSMPVVYNRHKQLFTKEWEATILNVSMKEYELKKAVTETFYSHLYLQEKEKLLKGIDSLYANLLQKANLRLQKGESNVLEKTTFETQRTAVSLQLAQAKQQMLMIEEIFQLLLNTDQKYIPSGNLKLAEQGLTDLSSIQEHPALKIAAQQQQIAKANTDVEKSKLLPELLAGYNNMSIRGTGADDVKYSAGQRFHSGQVGIGIPIFTGSQKARVKASRINEQVAENNFKIEKQALQNSYLRYLAQYRQTSSMLELYQNEYLKSVKIIKETANRQFLNGEINYLEFVMLINQAINIQSGYIDLLSEYNKSVIALVYLNK